MTEGVSVRVALGPLLGAGVVLCVAVVAALLGLAELPWLDALYLGALLALLPVLSIAQMRALDDVEIERIPAYGGSVVALMMLTGATVLVGSRYGGLEALGLVPVSGGAGAAWTVALVAAALVLILSFRQIALAMGAREHPVLRGLIPRTGHEKGVFTILSGWAGLAEELTYRGYAILTLAPALGTLGSVLLTSAVFGVLHAYQGALGMVRSGVMGALLACGFLWSGSLWPPIAAHVLIDLIVGLWLAERLMVPERTPGVEGVDHVAGPAGATDP